jgi:DNA-binding transcriptional MerR regulator
MPSSYQTPSLNLKAVVQLTDVKPDTLRAWERRYGLPQPQRSDGGHRLYSQRDVEIIKWLMARKREGLSIKRAVKLWQQLEADGLDPLRSATPMLSGATSVATRRAAGEKLSELRQAWVDACLAFDEQLAEQILTQAFALYPPETVCLELLQQSLAQIGEGWYRGTVTVQQEHFASALAMRHLEALIMATPTPTRPGRILVGGPPEEEHALSLLLLTFLLRRRGWEVLYLGANVPLARLKTTISTAHPQMIISAAQQLHTAATLLEMAWLLQQERLPLAFGGAIFNLLPSLRDRIPGHFLGERLEMVPQVVEALMAVPRSVPSQEAVPEAYKRAREHFRERRAQIEAHVSQALGQKLVAYDYLAVVNEEFAHNIVAALTLGNMDFLSTDLHWLTGLLKGHDMPTELLLSYLSAYYQAAKAQLDERGSLIVAWLARLVEAQTVPD